MRQPDSWKNAQLTRAIALVTGIAWLLPALAGWSDAVAIWAGFIPARVSGAVQADGLVPVFLTPLTATLAHGGIAHIGFNLLILLYCGRAVETIIGGRQLAILYIVGAYAAAAAHYAVSPDSNVPMIGASGAISAVIGTYAMMFGRNRVKASHPTVALWLNALWLAAAWVGLQLLIGVTFQSIGPQVAIAAHVGGFLAGLILAKPLLLLRYRGA